MAKGSIELQGTGPMLDEIRRRLGSASDRLESKALRAAGEPIAEDMKGRVNVSDRESRHLRDDIRVSRVVRKDGMKYVLVGATKRTSWRGHFLEWGTSKMTAQPFAEPAFHARKGEALQILADEFRKGLHDG